MVKTRYVARGPASTHVLVGGTHSISVAATNTNWYSCTETTRTAWENV